MLTKDRLYSYQHTTINHIIDNSHCGVFLDMGLGKTVSALTAVKDLISYLDITTTLVIAPKRVAENVWTEELDKWEHLQGLTISVIAGNETQRKKALAVKADVYTIGRDNVAWLCSMFGGGYLPYDMVIIDESSSFKNHKSVRFKALKQVQPSLSRVVLLTGTPAPNSLIDLWPQLYLLDRGERLEKYITRYRQKYFKPGQTNGAIVYNYNLQKDGKERIYKKINDICISMKAEDYLQLPGRVNNYIKINFDLKTQKLYDEFEREQIIELFEGQEITALSAAALSNKLLQYANGAVYDEDKNWHQVHALKLEACKEIIEDAGGKPVLIAWTYRHEMYRLKEYLKKYKPRELKTGQDIKDWNAGKIQVMLMHPASGGHGLNLQSGGNMIIWFGQTWSLELYQQFNARLDRQGQTEVVVINHLVACKTIDQDVIKALERKEKGQTSLMNAIKARINKYLK
jgi:SNF2 family DNA or RNA helicase